MARRSRVAFEGPRVVAQQAGHEPLRQSSNTAGNGTDMADLIIVYWRDIPAQVIVRKGRQNAKRELPIRFTEAIDMCAMRVGARDSDAYLADWRRGDPSPVGDDLEAEADAALADIDTRYDHQKLVALVKSEGRENG
jgi:hypothetical protein